MSTGFKREQEEWEDIVIISNMGGDRPAEEIEADAVTTCFQHYGMSVRSYVCVADCGAKPIFVAYHTDKDNVRYVKRMIPSTKCLRNIKCDVMILLGHGSRRSRKNGTPSYLSFHESMGVYADGVRRSISPDVTRIWSCSSCSVHGQTLTKPDDGVTLSEVVHRSKLVMMLCCFGEIITEDYEIEGGNTHNLRCDRQATYLSSFFVDPDVWYRCRTILDVFARARLCL